MSVSKKTIFLPILLVILAVLAIYTFYTYNKLVRVDENVKNGWANLQSSYQRRLDLIPQLVSTVKASSEYEKSVLTEIANARASASQLSIAEPNAENFNQLEKVQGQLAIASNKAIAIIEKYPELQTQKSFMLLQEQLVGTERRVFYSRKDFNATIKEYNTLTRNFPSSLVAKLFGFKVKENFKADEDAENAPQIKFSN